MLAPDAQRLDYALIIRSPLTSWQSGNHVSFQVQLETFGYSAVRLCEGVRFLITNTSHCFTIGYTIRSAHNSVKMHHRMTEKFSFSLFSVLSVQQWEWIRWRLVTKRSCFTVSPPSCAVNKTGFTYVLMPNFMPQHGSSAIVNHFWVKQDVRQYVTTDIIETHTHPSVQTNTTENTRGGRQTGDFTVSGSWKRVEILSSPQSPALFTGDEKPVGWCN